MNGILMLYYSIVFFVISVISGIFGFTKISSGAAGIAKILFGFFLLMFFVTLIIGIIIIL